MSSERPCGFSVEKNVFQNARNNNSPDYDGWIQIDESSWSGTNLSQNDMTTTDDSIKNSPISSSEQKCLPLSDISWHDGLIPETAEDNTDKFLQLIQATKEDGLVKDKAVSLIHPSVSRDSPAWNDGHSSENAQDNMERFRPYYVTSHFAEQSAQHERSLATFAYGTTRKRWLGVSRREPRLRLAKYRRHLIGQAQKAGYGVQMDYQLELTTTEFSGRHNLSENSAPTVHSNDSATTSTEMVENVGKSSQKRRRCSSPSVLQDRTTFTKRAWLRAPVAIKSSEQKSEKQNVTSFRDNEILPVEYAVRANHDQCLSDTALFQTFSTVSYMRSKEWPL